jgi:hypothetical protein
MGGFRRGEQGCRDSLESLVTVVSKPLGSCPRHHVGLSETPRSRRGPSRNASDLAPAGQADSRAVEAPITSSG